MDPSYWEVGNFLHNKGKEDIIEKHLKRIMFCMPRILYDVAPISPHPKCVLLNSDLGTGKASDEH